ncbi:MAG: circularly permuted type 2 ATP-grasp protein [Proteobacteria bacterium]|nr:circularly permuted type 2 ATP-grasp protein [Pseudomonadota bacterium]
MNLLASEGVDEMVDGARHIRPHWRGVLGGLSMLSDSLAARQRRLDQAFDDEGVRSILPGTHIDDEADGVWRCDPIPLPISAMEFAELEAGLAQRATLMGALLDDLYGRQDVLARGLLPPALVFNNPGFLRACHLSSPTFHPRLNFYAADLIRTGDGRWHVLSDRTSGAAGAGLARENRRILARVLPEMFRAVQIRPLRPFFDLWQDSLTQAAPLDRPHPTVALLTPGPGSPQWLEHMFLSRELSCHLVEGGDLTVRGGVVYLKMLTGLHRIDVILRRLEGRMIDPLELSSGSLLGVPGLMDAIRAGTVRVVNDPGSGLAEAPALAAFLPALCDELLGERLRLPSVETVWLGDPEARARVLGDTARWLIRSATDGLGQPKPVSDLDPDARARLLEDIARRPVDYAAMAAVSPSLAPCAKGAELVPQAIVLRMFLVRNAGVWQAMPGGLARHLEPGQLTGQLPARGISKDVWVLAEGSEHIVGPAPQPQTRLPIRRTFGELPSRTADNMFWLGRYIERLESAARLTRAIILRLGRNIPMPREHMELQLLEACLAASHLNAPERQEAGAPLAVAIAASIREGGTIARLLGHVGRLTELVRDRLTGEMYASFTHMLRAAADEATNSGGNLDALAHTMASIQRFSTVVAGLAAENMVRGGSWLFLDMGRRVERAALTCDHLGVVLDQPEARWELGLRLALEICDSAITYRSRYFTTLQPGPVLDLVIADDSNPRAVAFQLTTLGGLLGHIGDGGDDRLKLQAESLLRMAQAIVSDLLAEEEHAESLQAVPPRLAALAEGVRALSDLLFRRYFALLPMPRAVGVEQEDETPGLGQGVGRQPALRGAA